MARRAADIASLPPSVRPDLFGGHFRSFRGDPTGFLTRLSRLGDVAAFRMGPQRAFLVNHPDLIRDLLVVNAHKFKKGRALQRARSLLGDGLLTAEGEFHLRQRRMIQPAFHKTRIAEYARTMVDYAERMSGSWSDGDVRDIDHEMMHLTLQIVGKTLFGAEVGDEADEVGRAMTTLVSMFNFLLLPFSEWLEKLPLPQSRRYRHARDTLNSVIYGIIDERRRSGEDKGDLLSMLLLAQDEDDGRGMSDEQVRDEALTLFLAGHETTANALTWTWYLLSENPEVEAKLHEEMRISDFGFRNAGDRSEIPQSEIRDPQSPYVEAVVAESMRLYPPAWTVGRLAIEEHELGGYRIPKGSLVLASQWVMHRDPRFWDEPEAFRPERWLAAGRSVKEAGQRFIYFPFGGGTRRCIGEGFAWTEATLLLATLARRWRLRLVPEQKIDLQPMITLRPKFGMRMRLERR
ncbi:MAG: cytochrome P450 [Pyrinomonadaceae bacterium]